ncbi:MAG TPA: GNAT family N-acetyltransferase [Flavobacteriaceae bacterium]|nr:GNAT family N-acetyltransferase [Flavobacteriaceae bacterium]MCB9213273.1 GNAT family N-acetyltransferase [Alteromonas sp.]HPF12375.1 GNAT family N-acetyltransferase [Flavobacteriaceae bacterium]HQU22548.1 GNAT family N-acetyltransferase [Flavobacteriaceae bacterium]HQU66249.1 GNAT family N-acetyltransferase [Flavobacteriaceae bacterium]
MNLSIRPVLLKDAETLAKLSGQLGYATRPQLMEERIRLVLKNPDHKGFVAEANGMVLGWIHAVYSLRLESDPFVEIGGLVVNQNNRNQGIGKLLVHTAIAWAKTVHCRTVRVRSNVVRAESHRFYEALGFEVIKDQKILDLKLPA